MQQILHSFTLDLIIGCLVAFLVFIEDHYIGANDLIFRFLRFRLVYYYIIYMINMVNSGADKAPLEQFSFGFFSTFESG